MERFTGLIGVVLILGIAVLMSNKRKAINLRTVFSGLALQLGLALFILKTSTGQTVFATIGKWITRLLEMANQGGEFVFGGLMRPDLLHPIFGDHYSFLFMFRIMP